MPARSAWTQLEATARRLQAPGGCPWDRAQTVDSLLPHLIEEVWEAFSAHHRGGAAELEEELGDVLYTTLFLALLAERDGLFQLDRMLDRTREKMERRHPHVFGAHAAASPEDAYRHWQAAKRQERTARSSSRSTSKLHRKLLLTIFQALVERPGLRSRLKRSVEALVGATVRPKRPSAKPGPKSGRSQRRGSRRSRADSSESTRGPRRLQ